MTSNQIIVLATPVFFLFMAIEFAWGWHQARQGSGRNGYRLNDAINSVGLGMLSQLSAVFTSLLRVGLYTAIFRSVALSPSSLIPTSGAAGTAGTAGCWLLAAGCWLLALVFYDFCYYWLHRGGHVVAVLWANAQVYHGLWLKSRATPRWSDKLRYLAQAPRLAPANWLTRPSRRAL